MSILHRINLSRKFVVLGLIGLTMAAIPTYFAVHHSLVNIEVARHEAAGIGPVIALDNVIRYTQQHRGAAAGVLGGDSSMQDARVKASDSTNAAALAVEQALTDADASATLKANWNGLKSEWTQLAQAVATGQLTVAESTARHSALIAKEMLLLEDAASEFGLLLDPEPGTYMLITATLNHAPALTEQLGQLRARGTGVLAEHTRSTQLYAAMSTSHSEAKGSIQDMVRYLGRAFAADPTLNAEFAETSKAMAAQVEQSLELASRELLTTEQYSYPAKDYFLNFTATNDAVYAFNEHALAALATRLDERLQGERTILFELLAVLLVSLIGAVLLGLAFVRSVTGPIGQALGVAQAVAEGDLTVAVPVLGSNEIGQLMQALATMKDKLTQIVGQVMSSADSVGTGAGEIAAGNDDLSRRTQEQASSLEETAASMEEMAASVRHNSEHASQASQLARGARELAEQGGDIATRAVDAMADINESSRKIVDIISVIDEIAFQTNLLALNAAVEAARAGEQGRGFAVVASEVRSLAQRSAGAAKEIKALINDSVDKAQSGKELVDASGKALVNIVEAVKKVTDIVGEIAAANSEQASGVDQVNQAVMAMDEVTQQNAALVEEAAAASMAMQGQAQELVQQVSFFRIDGHAQAVSPPARATVQAKKAAHMEPARQAKPTPRPAAKSSSTARPTAARPSAVAAGGNDNWTEF